MNDEVWVVKTQRHSTEYDSPRVFDSEASAKRYCEQIVEEGGCTMMWSEKKYRPRY